LYRLDNVAVETGGVLPLKSSLITLVPESTFSVPVFPFLFDSSLSVRLPLHLPRNPSSFLFSFFYIMITKFFIVTAKSS
jgi:hypothetical protein